MDAPKKKCLWEKTTPLSGKNNTPSTCKTANRLSECTLESHCRRRRGESVPHITLLRWDVAERMHPRSPRQEGEVRGAPRNDRAEWRRRTKGVRWRGDYRA